jgi:ATP-binding protein involved in chromosome partitioning
MAIDQRQLEADLGAIVEPELDLPLGAIGFLREVSTKRRRARIEVALPVAAWPGSDELADEVHRVARAVLGVEEIEFDLTVMTDHERAALRGTLRRNMLGATAETTPADDGEDDHGHDGHGHGGHGHGADPTTPTFLLPESPTRVIGVSSGKGGVGKSTVTVNLAIALAQAGHRVGLLDADVYGFSVPKMLGTDHDPIILGDVVIPTSAHGVKCLSMGYFVPDDQPVICTRPSSNS